MKAKTVTIVAVFLFLLGVLACWTLIMRTARDRAPERSPAAGAARKMGAVMEFRSDGVAGSVMRAVERAARPGRARAAVRTRDAARWCCVLAHGPARYAELDAGLSFEHFPDLEAQGFCQPPPEVSRATTSVYRSIAKRAFAYDAARGDRIVILLCPREQWSALNLRWPE